MLVAAVLMFSQLGSLRCFRSDFPMKPVISVLGRGKSLVPLTLLLDYVSVEQLSSSGSKGDHFKIVNIELHSQILASVFGF